MLHVYLRLGFLDVYVITSNDAVTVFFGGWSPLHVYRRRVDGQHFDVGRRSWHCYLPIYIHVELDIFNNILRVVQSSEMVKRISICLIPFFTSI